MGVIWRPVGTPCSWTDFDGTNAIQRTIYLPPTYGALQHAFEKSRADSGRRIPKLSPKNGPGATAVKHFIFLRKGHIPTRNEKLVKVTDFGDPTLNIEWDILEKPLGEGGGAEAASPPRIG